ncbi:DNA/RNA non-specific endonuclease [Prevotella sp. A2931]|uniref:Endonuclease n=1 Tax=Prevotella illustrans TaxID=2800387 RepID=A0ABS3M7U4_9BACT|nr:MULTISPECIES: DNA/RNA non-specific endonuclease [Prevotella]MBO1364245.1 DNA/RNA non-specific endonuclease [Prevotella illustrans]PTL26745.1 endonuclease [Prevotella sp. oral taxon 820]
MKRNLASLCLLTLLVGLSGCALSTSRNHRPLMAGVRVASSVETETAEEEPSAPKTEFEALLPRILKAGVSSQTLRREGYVVSYNKDNRIPNWVMWHLTGNHTSGPFKRGGVKFQTDPEADGPQVTTYDYARSGYDRGHMCPSGDNKWSQRAQEQSFLLTNVCPQNHQLNAGDWNEMELQCRRWARQYGDTYVVAGPILLNRRHKTIGQAKVVVPEAFFKVVLCLRGKPKAIGVIYRNKAGNRPKGDYMNSVGQVERVTGIDFFPGLPDEMEQAVESRQDLSEW